MIVGHWISIPIIIKNNPEYGCQDIDCQRDALHLCKEGNKEPECSPHGTPFTLFERGEKTQDKECKEGDIYYDKRPETVGILYIFTMHIITLLLLRNDTLFNAFALVH